MLMPRGLSALETACGLVFGGDDGPLPRRPVTAPPARALADALVPAVRRGPCVVAFSGGRDSSLVLAAAVEAARRAGADPPVPVTLRFPHVPESEEARWQEGVVSHLGLRDWVRIELPEGLDVVGPVARAALLEHGPLFPANAHLLLPVLEHAAGGTVVTGVGGDELFGLWGRRRLADLAARRARPGWRDGARLAGAVAPPRVRTAVLRRRGLVSPAPWLRPAARARFAEHVAREQAHAALRWDSHVTGIPRARSLRVALGHLGRLARAGGAAYEAPLVDPAFAASLAAAGGWRGYGGRSATLQALFGELLPPDVLARRHKATFNGAFLAQDARRFAREWSGRGLDETVVDPEAVRRAWLTPGGDFRAALLLQSAWLHDHAGTRS